MVFLLREDGFFVAKLNIVGIGRINNTLKYLFHPLNDVFAVLTCINDPTNGLLEILVASL